MPLHIKAKRVQSPSSTSAQVICSKDCHSRIGHYNGCDSTQNTLHETKPIVS
uniref:Uncharacterized protein n=1 Tax=Arion vulgaris TaxID=1028688 RepID=A0A0B7A4I3_9EUPU